MSNFNTVIASQADIGIRFFLKIQGIPYIFLDGDVPTAKSGSTWSAPTSKGSPYAYVEHVLDVSGGISDSGSMLSRSSGDSQPGQVTLVLKERRGGFLHGLMAREKADGNYANLAASLPYDTVTGYDTATVDDTTGWDSSGYLYLGRETIAYDSLTSTTFESLTRDLFSVGDCDTIYRHETALPNAPRVVTDFPRVWHGRYVQLFAYVVSADGVAYDSTIDGDYSAEIWRGVIAGNPRPMDDWQRYELRCDSIESILDTEIGRDPVKGALMRIPQGGIQNNIGKIVQPEAANPALSTFAFWLDDNTRFVSIRVKEWADATAYADQDPPTVYDYTGDNRIALSSSAGNTTRGGLIAAWSGFVNGQLATDIGTTLQIQLHYGSRWWLDGIRSGSPAYEVEILWDAPGSVGQLLGFGGITKLVLPTTETHDHAQAQFDETAIYIPSTATTIPFFFVDTSGVNDDDPPEPGYVRIGEGDEAEIVRYESITSLSSSLDGIHLLEGVERGMMGTTAREHRFTLTDDWEADGEAVEMVFGVGVSGSLVDAILQFAVSTGYGVHGIYDVLGDKISVPLCPNHFDTDAIAAAGAQLTYDQATIGLFLSKPFNLRELISDWLRPVGMYLTSRTNDDGDFLITIDRLLPPLESEVQTSIGTAHLDVTDPAAYIDGIDRVINEIVLYPRWSAADEDNTEDKIVILDHDSISEYGKRSSIEWKLRGYRWPLGTAYDKATVWGYRLFSRYGRPYDLFKLRLNRAGLVLRPGDAITLSVPQAPNPSGTRGISSKDAVVLRVEKRWHPAMGSAEATGADVTVVLEPYIRASTYAPSARVASYSAGTPSVTLQANAYSSVGADVDHFELGDKVHIYNEGDAGTRDLVEIIGIAANVVTLSTTLTITVSSSTTIMVPADYDTAVASQQKHAYIADDSGTLGSGADDAFTWV